jgi:thioesterase domain-containing protein
MLENLYDSASEEYLPKPLDIHLTLFKPKQSYAGYSDTFFGWQNYVQDITLIELPVYPAGMLIEPFVAQLASHIERQLSLAEDGLVLTNDTPLSKIVL